MLTVANYENEVSNWNVPAQNETSISDAELLQRVNRIRSGWSVEERVARRREAERRFAELLDTLCEVTAA
jgi:hypothetical protein